MTNSGNYGASYNTQDSRLFGFSYKENDLEELEKISPVPPNIDDGVSVAAGGMYGMGKMMYGINQLQADGTINYNDAIGQRGQVYSRIKPNETGEIQVPVDGTLKTLLARAQDKSMLISSGEFIKVVDIIGSTMIVVPLDDGSSEE